MVKELFEIIWKFIDVILYFLGVAAIAYGCFLINKSAGYISIGAIALITAFLTEILARAAPKPAYSLSDDEDAINFLIAKSDKYVSADKALRNSDIFSLLMQLSGDLALVSLKASSERIESLINNPSSTTNGRSFWQSMYAQLLLDGNAYAYRWRNVNGVDLRWEYLRPSQVQPMLLEDGSGLVYNINFDEPAYGTFENVPQVDVIHIRLMSKNGGMTGMSPLTALSNELEIKDASNKLTMSALNQSVTTNGILKVTKGGLLDTKMRAARSRNFKWQLEHSDGGPAVIDDLKMMGSQYAQALNRFVNPIVSELDKKMNAKITADIRPAIDATGDAYADTLAGLTKNYALAGNQATYILQQIGYLPKKLPKAASIGSKGGEIIDNNTNQRTDN